MKRLAIITAIFVSSISAAPVAAQEADYADVAGPARVVDGDTLAIGSVKIRLHGIDAPEKDQTCQTAAGAEYPCGLEAKEALERITAGQIVHCRTTTIDKYGRSVARCTAANRDIGAVLVGSGIAVAFTRYSSDYVAYEREAINLKRGLWSGQFQDPSDYRHAKRSGAF